MKKIVLCVMLGAFGLCGFAQPAPKGKPSAYEQVNGMKKELGLDDSQFKKVYRAYEKYNNAVFGNTSANSEFQGPPSGGRPGGNGGAPMGGRPGSAPQGGDRQFGGGFPGDRRPQPNAPELENMEKLQKTMDKQEEKLNKSMKKLFKKDSAKYAQWQKIRERQLKNMTPVLPMPSVGR